MRAAIDLPGAPLVSADWLAERLGRPGLIIVDARKGDGYVTAHIPGARKLGLDPHLHHPGRVEAPEVFAAEMTRLGVGARTLVVAYDDGNNLFGARLWWVLRHYGHDKVAVLDAGWDGWLAAGLPVSDAPAADAQHGSFAARITPDWLATTADVRAAMEGPARQILDVRGNAEWLRQAPTESSMAGHIPGARHMVWTECLDPASKRFLPAETLRDRFTALGLRPEAEVVVYCQGGIRAAHTVLALTVAGYTHVRNYEGSWAEWSRAKMPAVVEPASVPASQT